MHLIKITLSTLTAALFALPVSVNADSWICSHDNDVREVHIERTSTAPAPCDVVYKKQTEGVEDQILWNAQNDGNYCDEKAKDFVAKLESWGWVCAETIRQEPTSNGDEEDAANTNDASANDDMQSAPAVDDAGSAAPESGADGGDDE